MPRLFVALWPPSEVLDDLARLERPPLKDWRWTTRGQWHVTLRFLGEVDDGAARVALAAVAAAPTEVAVGPLARRLGRSVLVLPVAGLDDVAAAVRAATASLGTLEQRPFRGHLTLARARRDGARPPTFPPFAARWTATSVTLVESRLHPQGARYETIADHRLSGRR
jgi:2'-5' RNA ligase